MLESIAASLPPGLILIFGAFLLPLLPGKAAPAEGSAHGIWPLSGNSKMGMRGVLMLLLPILGLIQMWLLPLGHSIDVELFGYALQPVRVDRLSRIFGTIFHIAALISVIYSLRVRDTLQNLSGLAYAGAAIGAVFAGDLITLFVYWELTALTSVFLIWARRTNRATRVGMRYLTIQVLSGVLLLAGTLFHYADTGSLAFDLLSLDGSIGHWLIFLSFGIKAAFPMLHSWLEDSYPEATITGTVWMSAFTTKMAIYALARGFAGTEILIPIGAAMTAFPIFFAVIENDLRRVLSYSLNNQLGFMVVGIGVGTELAINGAAAHAFAHILYKGLLFMTMGAVLLRAGTVNASDLGGLWRKMPWTTAFCVIGAMAISAFPLFSGFVTKSMILTAAADEGYTWTFLILLFASAGVLDHSGIKVPYFAFFAHDSKLLPKITGEAPRNMLVAMAIAAFLCIAVGVYPAPLYALLPYEVGDYTAYDLTHVVTQMQLLLGSAAAFVFLKKLGWYPAELRSTVLDVDWVYRKLLPGGLRATYDAIDESAEKTKAAVGRAVLAGVGRIGQMFRPGDRSFGEPWPSGETALWAAVVLVAYLVVSIVGSQAG
ncbi:MAG: multicomponent Na+:H+ antiporter subunit D [Cognaticolwellia sp.]|jgi:multicomponent Na+:H+ antiporter subunit D